MEDNKLICENAEVYSQRLICLEKSILVNPELMKIFASRTMGEPTRMATHIHTLASELMKLNIAESKAKL